MKIHRYMLVTLATLLSVTSGYLMQKAGMKAFSQADFSPVEKAYADTPPIDSSYDPACSGTGCSGCSGSA